MSKNTALARTVLMSLEYKKLSAGARALYPELGFDATNIGEVFDPHGLARYFNLSESAADELLDAGFLIECGGRVFIKHHRVNNTKPSGGMMKSLEGDWGERPVGLEFEGKEYASAFVVRDFSGTFAKDSANVWETCAKDSANVCTERNGNGRETNRTRSESEPEDKKELEGEGSPGEGEVVLCPDCNAANEVGAHVCFACDKLLPERD